jgi:hypothetical protein
MYVLKRGCLRRQPLLFPNQRLPQTPKGNMLIISQFPSGNKRVKLAEATEERTFQISASSFYPYVMEQFYTPTNVLSKLSNMAIPSWLARFTSAARSGCGIMPKTLRPSLVMPAIFSADPFGLDASVTWPFSSL